MSTIPYHRGSGQGSIADGLLAAAAQTVEKVVFHHRGMMGAEVVRSLLDLAEETSVAHGDPVTLRKRLINVLVEGLENIDRHAGEHLPDANVMLVRVERGYGIFLGNGMPVMLAAMMEHRLGLLNEMSEAELKEYYMKLLSNEGRTERGGAGLGLMAIARKCTRPMTFHMLPMDDRTAYGMLEVRIMAPEA